MINRDEIPDGLQLTPFDADFYADPYAVYQRLQTLDPIHKDRTSFYAESWTICGYQRVNRLLRDSRLSTDPRTIGIRRDPRADNAVTLREPDMMNLDGPEHQRLRALVQKAFTPRSVQQFKPQIEAVVDECLDAIPSLPFDVVPALAKPIPTKAIAEFMGVDSGHHVQFKQWTDSLLLQGYPMPTADQWDEILDADAALRDYMDTIVQQRRRQPADDLISRMVAAQEQDARLTNREIVDMCYLLIGAGNFTTTDLISNSINLLLAQPEKDYSDTSLAPILIEECLRMDSPVLAVRRFARETLEVDGTTIPKGSVVSLVVAAANHDSQQFANPEGFDAQRQPNAHLSFGRGIHHCLGSALAKLEAQVTVEKLGQRYPNLQLSSAKRSKRMDFRGFSSLVVT